MKLTVGYGQREGGFALPTILLVSTVMLIILTASIAATASSRVSLDSQFYNQLAEQAAQSGIARSNECLKSNGYVAQWSTIAAGKDLRPNSDCTGATMTGSFVSPYVIGAAGATPSKVRTTYSVEAPSGTGVGSILRAVGTTELVRSSEPYDVWRTYEQSLYLRIEPPQMVVCPAGFASVPGDSRFGTRDFCIGKYEAKNVGGKAVSQAEGTPYTSITQADAIAAAEQSCTGCHLVTEAEWLTVAHNVTNVAGNWTNEIVGSGLLYRGHTDNVPAAYLDASTNDADGYYGTSNTTGEQRRTLTLNNGEVVWDMAGNVWEWTAGKVTGGQPGAAGFAWRNWNAVGGTGTMSPNPFPVYGTPAASSWTSAHGIGQLYSDTGDVAVRPVIRGGKRDSGGTAGVFSVALNNAETGANSTIGFRIAYEPLSVTSCSSGMIPVPGNSAFGTSRFCVGKYEAKNVGGKAVSQPGGTPWVNISQTDAATAANAACPKCRLIGEAEWLTIAHNLLSVPSNWTGGAVGSGTIYRGHSDNSPAAAQAASADDNDGYFGTGNASGSNQRRTLTLNNGEVIWDFSGNIWEYTSGQITGAQPGDVNWVWREWNAIPAPTLVPNPLPSFGTPAASAWNSTNGLGKLYSNSAYTSLRAFLRSGNWGDANGYGLFTLALNRSPDQPAADAGFRVVEIK